MRVSGSLAFVDISGFTRLTERLARKGKVGAEEMSDILDATFAGLLHDAMADGADLVKWGGDAVLLLFHGPDHAPRAARAAHRMRATMRRIGRIETSSGTVVLRMSVGVHSGDFDFFLVGDPEIHRELLISGPAASTTAEFESAADAGQIGLSAATAALLPDRLLGPPLLDGRLLRTAPDLAEPSSHLTQHPGTDGEQRRTEADGATSIDPAEALSPPIRAHLLGGGSEPEHRAITVAFVQFAGSDRLLATEGPVALAAALDDVVRNVQHACADHDVTFFETDINRDGGKVMLTAGAPRSADHHEERMLRLARQVLDRVDRLPLRIGINRGHVFSGDFGPPFRRTYSVKGDAINLAARLLGRAAPGQAVATTEVVAHSQTTFRTEQLAPFTVKGKSSPIDAAVLGELVGTRSDGDLAVEMVGRAGELAVLSAALADARAGCGGAVEVLGLPGMGRTRLVTELLDGSDTRALASRCEAYESSTAYYPFRKLLRDALGIGKDPEEAARQLVDRVAALAPPLTPWAPLLAIPLDLAVPATPQTAELDDRFLRSRLESLVVDLLTAALPDATAILVEDVHHIDDASASLLRALESAAAERPWLVLVTRREQRDDDGPGSESASGRRTTLRLGPLDDAATMELTRRALADQPLTPHAMRVLADRSGGNPLFLAALLDAARQSHDVTELPDTVEALVSSDIDRLAPEDRRALRYAAVLGSVVDEAILGQLLAGPEAHQDGQPALEDGVLRRLDRFLVHGQSGRLRFRSTLLRDVAYEGLPYRRRRLLHGQVGTAIEQAIALGGEAPESQAEVLSLHFFHAGDEARAWRYSVVAGRRAVDKHAHGDALGFYERAAHLVPRAGSVTPEEHAAVFEQLADSRFLVGLTDEATEAYAAARRLVPGDPARQAFLVEKEVRVDLRRRRFAQAMRRLTRGLRALEGVSGQRADVARSLLARRYAYSRFSQGRVDEALRWAETAARHAEESLDKGALAQAYEMLNAIHAGSGREEPLPYGRLALQANRELGDLPPQGHCLNNLAVEAFTHGRWDEALVEYRQATDIFRRIGDTASEGNAAFNQAELLVRQGRFEEAAALLPEVLLIARAVEDDELVALALREQAQTVAGQADVDGSADGEVDGGLAVLDESRRLFAELGEEDELVMTDLVRTEMLLRAGRTPAAAQVLDGLRPAEGVAALDGMAARWHRLAAHVHSARGGLTEARDEIMAGLERAVVEEDRFEQALLLRDLVELSRRTGEPADADVEAQARDLLDSMGVVSGR